MSVYAVSVRNRSLGIDDFNALCDRLSALRKWCHDYRIVRDFDATIYPLYWNSYSYTLFDEAYIAQVSVQEDVNRFLESKDLPADSVKVLIVNVTL